MVEACIFDLDGVIVDTARYHYLAWKEIAAELGFDFSEKDNERLKGVSRVRSMEILLEVGGIQLDQKRKTELMDKKNDNYVAMISKMTADEILPGAFEFINVIKARNIKIALGSASKNALTILKRIGMDTTFDAIVDGNKVAKAKPDPEVFLKAAEELNVLPKNCAVFEDAEAGVEAALKGGMFVVGIGEKEILGKAHYVIPGFNNVSPDDFHFFKEVEQLQ